MSSSTEKNGSIVRMSTSQWIGLIALLLGASAANITGMHTMTASNREMFREDMKELDLAWQARIEGLARDFRGDINDVKASIPPDWFRSMVEHNQDVLQQQDQRLHRLETRMERIEFKLEALQGQ